MSYYDYLDRSLEKRKIRNSQIVIFIIDNCPLITGFCRVSPVLKSENHCHTYIPPFPLLFLETLVAFNMFVGRRNYIILAFE